MEGNKCTNVLWYSYWRAHIHADAHIKSDCIYTNRDNKCGNDKKNQRS